MNAARRRLNMGLFEELGMCAVRAGMGAMTKGGSRGGGRGTDPGEFLANVLITVVIVGAYWLWQAITS
jgi:hypothetical protein